MPSSQSSSSLRGYDLWYWIYYRLIPAVLADWGESSCCQCDLYSWLAVGVGTRHFVHGLEFSY